MSSAAGDIIEQYEIGVQSFTYREFNVPEICSALAETEVTAIELCDVHVTPRADEETIDGLRKRLDDAGLDICGYGVVPFEGDHEESIRQTFELVDRLGADYCSVEFPPDDQTIRGLLVSQADEYDLDLAIHNHGPGATYSTVEEVANVVEAADDPRLGACVDTGHYFRSGEEPADVIPRLGDSVLALHLKDFVDAEREAVPGTGQLDVPELLSLLDAESSFDQPLVIEYEADAEDPTPAVKQTVAEVRDAME